MSLLFRGRCLSYSKIKILKVTNLKTQLENSARTLGGMSADLVKNGPLDVEHNSSEKEFFIRLGEEKAYLQYSRVKPNLVDLEHTVVPEQHRGHGIGHVLAQSVFDHFVKEDINMKLTCTFLQKFYEDNPLPHYTEKVVEL